MNITVGNANVTKLIQTGTLARSIGEALYPGLLYRGIAHRELWEGGVGQTMDFLMPGLFPPNTKPRKPGVARPPQVLDYERYQASVEPYGDEAKAHMPTNYITAVSSYMQQMKALGLQAAQSVNRLARDELFRCYQWGTAIVDDISANPVITVSSLNGFRKTFDPDTAAPIPVSNVNSLSVKRNGTLIAQKIIAAVPADEDLPDGPGTLTFDGATPFAAGDRIEGLDAVPIIRPGNKTSIDAISVGDILNMKMIRRAVTSMRTDSIQTCGDNFFHIHFEPVGEEQLFEDNRLQRQIETLGLANDPYLSFSIGRTTAGTFFSNNESPSEQTLSNLGPTRPVNFPKAMGSGEIGGEIINKEGVVISKAIVIGASALVEKYIDERAFMTEAGVSGRVGGMNLSNGRVEIDLSGIRFIHKAPTDIYNEFHDFAWSVHADWVCPTNFLSGRTGSRYKRARVIEFAA